MLTPGTSGGASSTCVRPRHRRCDGDAGPPSGVWRPAVSTSGSDGLDRDPGKRSGRVGTPLSGEARPTTGAPGTGTDGTTSTPSPPVEDPEASVGDPEVFLVPKGVSTRRTWSTSRPGPSSVTPICVRPRVVCPGLGPPPVPRVEGRVGTRPARGS